MLYCIIDTILRSWRAASLQLSFQIIRICNCLSEFTTCVISVKQNIKPLAFPCSLSLSSLFSYSVQPFFGTIKITYSSFFTEHLSPYNTNYWSNAAYVSLHKEIKLFWTRGTEGHQLKREESHLLPKLSAAVYRWPAAHHQPHVPPAAPVPTLPRPTAMGFVLWNHNECAAVEGSCRSRSSFVRFRHLSPGTWLYKAQTCDLGLLSWQTVTEWESRWTQAMHSK